MPKDRKNKILLVDDDPLNILILEEILGEKYELKKAGSADEAISIAGRFRPDLILLDIMMPGADGFDVCRQLRKNQHLQFTKIILVSAKTLLKDRLEGYKAGADDYISKPFDPDELLAKVRIFIRLKSVEEIDRVKDDLINLFSHETRTPMNAVIGFAKFLKESPNLLPEEKEGVDLIVESATNLLELINKTLLLSSLREENRELTRHEIEVESLLLSAKEKEESAATEKSVDIQVEHGPVIKVNVDTELIQTALNYLLNNAVKFTASSSVILLKCYQDHQKCCRIEIKDAGNGVPDDRLEFLFDEFGVEDISHHGRGHGLSLAIVKYIVEMHNGEVAVENNVDGPGATFSLILPEDSIMA